MKAVAAAGGAAVNGGDRNVQLSSTSSSRSSSALEQLDIERGVCTPFRKYSPETVSICIFILYFKLIIR